MMCSQQFEAAYHVQIQMSCIMRKWILMPYAASIESDQPAPSGQELRCLLESCKVSIADKITPITDCADAQADR
ncbi:hypothetical protein DPMN_170182 [Dreissena polymorpha]|uniref:Uncharacterized protein n=1 Tax=Dreissena polymorpha TaxID=45954 RepID=A0A9D4DWK9_DREPO|nr:hypothetical protein DPMN_170182 [Dreissena polymorpha]